MLRRPAGGPATSARAAAAGSAAAVIGRPTTRRSAPAASASAGVIVRFWSLGVAPSGRMPGHHDQRRRARARRAGARSRAASRRRRRGRARSAQLASRSTCSSRLERTPMAARSSSSRLVSTVTPAAAAGSASAAASAAAAQHGRAAGGVQRQERGAEPAADAHRAGHRVRDVVQLEVEEHRQPALRRTARTPAGPWAVKNSSPSFSPPTAPRSARGEPHRTLEVGAVDGAEDGIRGADTTGLSSAGGVAEAYSRAARACQSRDPVSCRRSGGLTCRGKKRPPPTRGGQRGVRELRGKNWAEPSGGSPLFSAGSLAWMWESAATVALEVN